MTTTQMRFYPRKELLQTQTGWKEIAPVMHAQIDARLQTVADIQCAAGCAHCCKLKVEVLPHEAMDVVDYIRWSDRFTREERADLLAKLTDVVARTEGLDENAYRAADVACPFLGDDDRCRVYPVRPIACRAFGSTNVKVCALEVPDTAPHATFRVLPDALSSLLATSGLFFTPYLRACLDWWHGSGIASPVEAGQAEAVAQIQELLDAGRIGVRNGAGAGSTGVA
jgi:Fe-S-cluster containining protein